MPRRNPRLLVVASAVLLAGVVTMWARSYWYSIWVHLPSATSWPRWWPTMLSSAQGQIFLSGGPHAYPFSGYERPLDPRSSTYVPMRTRLAGLEVGPRWVSGPAIRVPHWFAALVVGLPLAWAVAARLRPPPGQCRSCGYDLTANTSGRRPECGTEAPSDAARAGGER